MSGFSEDATPFAFDRLEPQAADGGKETFQVKVGPGGRVVIPADIRSAMHVSEGDVLLGEFDGASVRLSSMDTLLGAIHLELAKLIPPHVSVVDEFLAERRAMWGEDED